MITRGVIDFKQTKKHYSFILLDLTIVVRHVLILVQTANVLCPNSFFATGYVIFKILMGFPRYLSMYDIYYMYQERND